VRIAKTAGLVDAGHWTSVPANLVTSSVTSTASAYVYRFTLNAGATLSPGSYTFAAQYSHDAGTRSVAADAFDATATATRKAHVKGDFS